MLYILYIHAFIILCFIKHSYWTLFQHIQSSTTEDLSLVQRPMEHYVTKAITCYVTTNSGVGILYGAGNTFSRITQIK